MASIDLSISPWLTRVFDRAPVSLPVMAALVALAHFISLALLEWTLFPASENKLFVWASMDDVAGDIVHSVLVGYLLVASYYGLREAVRDFLRLQPDLSCDEARFSNLLTRLRHVSRAPVYIASAAAVVWGFGMPLLQISWPGMETPPFGSAPMTFRQFEEILFVFIIFRTIAIEFVSAFFFASVARHYACIELFDLQRLTPFSQRALRGVLVVMVFMAILSLMVIFDSEPITSVIGVIFASLSAAALFLIPLIPLQQRIQAEKSSELARIQAALRRDSQARIAGDEDWAPRANLIVYKQQIENVSTWTSNTPTLVRFALYASLGIGSWLGAAFVERWVGTLLG